MTDTLSSLLTSIQARQTCPACDKPRKPASMPTQWHHHRAIFECGAVFMARGERIEAERACPDRSDFAATLWTVEARGGAFASAVSQKVDQKAAVEDGAVAGLVLTLAITAVRAGFDHLTICELIRDEMQSWAARPEGKAPEASP
jgi:hypothetical protein